MAMDDILLEAEDKMIKTEQVVINEFAGVRTGKASPALVENLMAEVYGAQMRIRELAGITTPELSEERRQEFVKIIRKMAEDGRVAIRHVRRDCMEQMKKHAHDSGTTEDE